jgi:hypothetical protein
MYKGCTRDSQGTNTLTTPEQYRSNTGAIPEQHQSNTLSPDLHLALGGLWNPNRSSSRLPVGSNGANHLGTVELHRLKAGEEKRQRTGAVQDASRRAGRSEPGASFWTAPVLWRLPTQRLRGGNPLCSVSLLIVIAGAKSVKSEDLLWRQTRPGRRRPRLEEAPAMSRPILYSSFCLPLTIGAPGRISADAPQSARRSP